MSRSTRDNWVAAGSGRLSWPMFTIASSLHCSVPVFCHEQISTGLVRETLGDEPLCMLAASLLKTKACGRICDIPPGRCYVRLGLTKAATRTETGQNAAQCSNQRSTIGKNVWPDISREHAIGWPAAGVIRNSILCQIILMCNVLCRGSNR